MYKIINRKNEHNSLNRRTKRVITTDFIKFTPAKCRACWKCINECPGGVFGKINILIHKHVLIKKSSNCIGCGKCVKTCSSGAINFTK